MVSLVMVLAALSFSDTVQADNEIPIHIDLQSDMIGVLGLPVSESKQSIFRLAIKGKVQKNGEGTCELVLDPTGLPAFDEFGFPGAAKIVEPLKLDCRLKFVKRTTRTYTSRRLGAPPSEVTTHTEETSLYSIRGQKVTSRFYLSLTGPTESHYGRFLVQGDDARVKYSIDLRLPPQQEPCHPGCFPAGILITTPEGEKSIEQIAAGDSVTTVSPMGIAGKGKVAAVFVTRNRLIEVKTDKGSFLTTETQPLCLSTGILRSAGEIQPGDRIKKWEGGKPSTDLVKAVVHTGRDAQVFNLVLGEPVLFVAGGYLARSKPPGVMPDPNVP